MKQFKMSDFSLTKRQSYILQIIDALGEASNHNILKKVSAEFDKASRVTVIRDLNVLLKRKAIKKVGKGRAVAYVSNIPIIERSFDVEQYFSKEADKREIKKDKLDFLNKDMWGNLLNPSEAKLIDGLTKQYQERLSSYDKSQKRNWHCGDSL